RKYGVVLGRENAMFVVLLGLVTQHQDDLAFGVDSGVVVVVILGCCDSITREDLGAVVTSLRRKAERDVIESGIQFRRLAGGGQDQTILRTEAGIGDDLKGLQEILSVSGLQSEFAILIGDVFRGDFELGTAACPPLQLRRREIFHIVEIKIRVDFDIRSEERRGYIKREAERE